MTRSTAGIAMTAVSLVLGLLTACGSGPAETAPAPSSAQAPMPSMSSMPAGTGSPSSSSSTPDAAGAVIVIEDFAFSGPASVSPGATVTVINKDSQRHTVTSKGSKAFDALVEGRGGKVTFKAPATAGSYPYVCTFHGNMTGMLVVK